MTLRARHRRFPLVEHLDVATQRQRREHILGAVAADAAQQRRTEANGKPQDADPAAARYPVVTKLVKGYQQAQRDDQPPDRTKKFTHTVHST